MKILSFISSLSKNSGGPSRSVPMLAKGLSEIGIDITLLTFRSDNMNVHALEHTTAKLYILEKNWNVNEVEKFIVTEKFDLIQIQSIWDFCYHIVAKIARKHNIPYIVTPRGMLEPWSLIQKKWKKKIAFMLYQMRDLKRASCIYTTAEMEAQNVRQLGVNVPISVIPNGIETDSYPCRTSITNIKKNVLFLSRIHIKKGIEILIEAWGNIHKDFPEWKLIIVGNGNQEYVDHLKSVVKTKGLYDSIEINNPVFGIEKIKLYQESSLFCLPSYSENFGMVIAEAMSCGVPVLTTNNCPWHVLNETKTGWCIELSVNSLEKNLREALSMNSSDLYDMGQRASKLVFERYNYRMVAEKTKVLYEWILKKGKRPDNVLLSK